MTSRSDQNLLFGIIALQLDLVRREQLVAAASTWLTDKSRRIDEILVEQDALSEEDRQLLAPLVARHLDNHGGDAQQSLAALSGIGSAADALRSLGDENIEATLSMVASDQPDDEHAETAIHESEVSAAASDSTNAATDARFCILRSHARGGLGEVYVAKDTELNREVALKEIQTRYAGDENSRLRFLLEAEVTGGLEHPGIVPVYGLGRYEDGRPFYAMRFIKGDSLQEAADRFHGRRSDSETDSETGANANTKGPDFNSLEFRKLLGRFTDVCQAIEYAHSRGVLHRDLKPGNIMLGKYGETLVVDWGLAKAQGRDVDSVHNDETTLRPASASGSARTVMGSAIGTPAFMPPEQAGGDLDLLGQASDVYSLGATLYYMLAGRAPFQGKDVGQVLENVKSGKFAPPRSEQPGAPQALSAVCLKAMALHTEGRYASPLALADDIERFLADEPVLAYREPVAARVRRWVRKHQTVAVATAAVLLVSAVGLSVFSAVVNGKNVVLTRLNGSLDQKNVELTAAKQRAEAERNEKSRISAKLAFDRARQLSEQGEIASGLHWYVRAAELAPRDDAEFQDLIRANVSSWEGQLIRLTSQVQTPAAQGRFSADGQTVYIADPAVGVTIWDTGSGRLTRGLPFPESELDLARFEGKGLDEVAEVFTEGATAGDMAVAVSSDQTTCAASLGSRLFAWDIDNPVNNAKEIAVEGTIRSIEFHPAKNYVLLGTSEGQAILYDIDSGQQLGDAIDHGSTLSSAIFSPNGDEVLTCGYDGWVRRWRSDSAEKIEPAFPFTRAPITAAYSPDGKRLVVGYLTDFVVWDAESGQKLLQHATNGAVRCVDYSEDGRRFAIGSEGGIAVVWDAQKMTPVGYRLKHNTAPWQVALGPEGNRLSTLSALGVARTWRLPAPGMSLLDLQGFIAGSGFAVAPNGAWVALGNMRGQLQIQGLKDGDVGTRVIDFGEPIASLAVSGDSRLLFVGGFRGTGHILDPRDGTQVYESFKAPAAIMGCAFLNEERIAIGAMNGAIAVWNPRTGETSAELLQTALMSLTAVGDDLVTTGHENTVVQFWNVEREEVGRSIGTDTMYHEITSDADGRYVAACGEAGIMVWSAGGEVVARITAAGPVRSIALCDDGHCLASANAGTMRFWHLPTGQPLGPVLHFQDTGSVAFDSRNRLMADVVVGPTLVDKPATYQLYVRPTPVPVKGSLEALRLWAQRQTGFFLDEDGHERVLAIPAWIKKTQPAALLPAE